MNAGSPTLAGRLDEVRSRIGRAAERAGRDPATVTLVGVTKQVPAADVREATALGLSDLGENRIQEAEAKVVEVGRHAARWHMIGHLQRNKVGSAVELFDRIHGVDGLPLAEALSRRVVAAGRTLPVMVEVNVSREATKFGIAPEQLEELLATMVRLPGLVVDGLMTVGPPVDHPEDARPGFAALRALRDRAERRLGVALPQLSMGMSGDFEVAIEEGATLVRVGTALFGARA